MLLSSIEKEGSFLEKDRKYKLNKFSTGWHLGWGKREKRYKEKSKSLNNERPDFQ